MDCYNSGTTLLAQILRKHPDISGLPIEGTFLTDALPQPESFGWNRMWWKCLEQVRLEPDSVSPATLRRIKRQWSVWLDWRKPNLLDKSIPNTARMPFLQAEFGPAYFVYIVRNGYAVAEGALSR